MEKQALALSSPSMADTHQLFFVMPVYERGKTHEEMDILRHTTPAFFSFFSICIYERGKTHGEISIFLTLTQTHNTSSLISCLFMKEANPMEL